MDHQQCKAKVDELKDWKNFRSYFDDVCQKNIDSDRIRYDAQMESVQDKLNLCHAQLNHIKTTLKSLVKENIEEKCEGLLCNMFQTVMSTISEAIE